MAFIFDSSTSVYTQFFMKIKSKKTELDTHKVRVLENYDHS